MTVPGSIPDASVVVVWRVTEHCDLGCGFCGYSRHLRRPRASADEAQVLSFGAALGEYARSERRAVLVSWLGGEPLRWPPVFDLSHVFRNEFGLQVSATTNGTALASAVVRQRVAEDFDQLTVSVDGLGAQHDAARQAPGLFEKLRSSLLALRELRHRQNAALRLRVNTILMRDNLAEFEDFCCVMAKWGFAELTFNVLGGRERPEYYQCHYPLPEQITWLMSELPGIRERAARLGLTILGNDQYLQRLARGAQHLPSPVFDCGPGHRFLFIDADNVIAPCGFTGADYGIHVSEFRTAQDLRGLPRRLAERRRQSPLPVCNDCPSTQVFGKFAMPLAEAL